MKETAHLKEDSRKKSDIKSILDDQTLNASIHECGYASLMVGAGENFLAPYAIFLKASNLQLGFLSSLPLLLGSISQLLGVWLSELSPSRLRLIMACVFAQAMVWLPIAVLYFLGGQRTETVWILIFLYAAYFISGSLSAPAWNSLIGEAAPAEMRGRFFGLRNERGTIVMLLTLLAAGAILELLTKFGLRGLGFFILFFSAFAARMISLHYLSRHKDPPYKIDPSSRFSYFDFLKRSYKSNFARFVFFLSAMSFSVMVSGPFFSIYMLSVLNFSYFTYTSMTVMALTTTFLTMRYWGKLADKYGNKSLLCLCSIGVVINPLLWLIWSSVPGCLFIQAFGGVAWAGYNLAAANFLFDAVTPQKRARCVAYQSITNAVFIFFGTVIGAWLVNNLPDWFPFSQGIWTPKSPYLQVFFLSGVLRALSCYLLLPRFKEVRDVSAIKQTELFMQFIFVLPYIGTKLEYFMGRKNRDHLPR